MPRQKKIKFGHHLIESTILSRPHFIVSSAWKIRRRQGSFVVPVGFSNCWRFNCFFQSFRSSRYLSFIFCILILVGLEACARRVVEESTVTPATYRKTVPADQRAYQAMTRGDYKTGIRLYEQIIAKDPNNATALYYLGYAYGQTGDRIKEVALYEKAILLGYRSDQIYHNLGEAYLELGEVEKSVQAFKQGLAINPKSADNHFGLAKAFQETHAYDLAEQQLLITIRLEPAVVEFREFLGLFYLEMGQPHKAAEQFEHILEIDPDHEGAREFLEHIIKQDASGKKPLPGIGGQ